MPTPEELAAGAPAAPSAEPALTPIQSFHEAVADNIAHLGGSIVDAVVAPRVAAIKKKRVEALDKALTVLENLEGELGKAKKPTTAPTFDLAGKQVVAPGFTQAQIKQIAELGAKQKNLQGSINDYLTAQTDVPADKGKVAAALQKMSQTADKASKAGGGGGGGKPETDGDEPDAG